jgi:hypothetical protein
MQTPQIISNFMNELISTMSIFYLDTNVPLFISFLFLIVFAVLFYIVLVWIFAKYSRNNGVEEGFENPQYTYLPNNRSPNLFFKFGLSDLAVDISSACGFIKIDSKLNANLNADSTTSAISTTSPNLTTSANQIPEPTANQTTTTMTPSPYSTEKIESFATNEENTALPTTTSPKTETESPSMTETESPSITETESPSITETESPSMTTTPSITETQAPLPTAATNLNSNTNGDYIVPYTQLQIYKLYNTATGYSSTSNDNIYKIMDMSYGRFFDTVQLNKLTEENVAKLWNENASIIIDDTIYNGANYFVIQSGMDNRKCASSGKAWTGLSSYFLQQIQKNKSSSSVLLSLKNAYYAIIKPRFLINTLSNVYWQNVRTLTNSDKGTHDSIIFVLNTCGSLATSNTLKTDLAAEGVAKIVSEDTPFTMDSLWLYQLMSISFELYRYIAYFKEYGSVTTSSGNPAITTDISKFVSGHPIYLQKINQVSPESPLVFLLKNPPNNSECPVITKLTPYYNNLNG